MGLLDQLFGGEMSTAVRFVIAFGVVLALIALTFVGLRRFAGRRLPISNAGGRARQPRLGVLDAFAIDARRRLVLIRRDNVEHLIMIGGPNDLLIESEIVRAPAQAGLAPQRQRAPTEGARAAVPPPQGLRAPAAQDQAPVEARIVPPAPQPETPGRPAAFRNILRSAPPAPRTVPEPVPVPPATPVPPPAAAKPAAAPAKPAARAPQAENAPEAPAAAPPPPAPPPSATAKPKAEIDPLFADIERKLGEALAPRSPAASTPAKPAAAPPPPPSPAPRREPEPRRAPEPEPEAPAAKDQSRRSHLDALEEEMANLLGRDRS